MTTLCLALLLASEPGPHALYDGEGRPVTFDQLVTRAAAADVVFFGELHDNATAHRLQLRLAAGLHAATGGKLVLGAEMYERDAQLVLDEFLAGRIRERDLAAEGKVWPNHEADYLPLVQFARDHGLPFVASNVPRRYAALVAREGLGALETLSAAARPLLAPLPLAVDTSLPGYRAILQMPGHPGADPERMVAAQALKDATMADSIARALPAEGTFLHFNGAYHSNGREGIVWYLERQRPGLGVLTISTVAQETLGALGDEARGVADVILVTSPTPRATP